MSSLPTLIRLSPHPFASLPYHPDLDGDNSGTLARPDLKTFLATALAEAHTLVSSTIPNTFHKDKKLRASPPSSVKVELSTRFVRGSPSSAAHSYQDEFWVCRRSVHEDAAKNGTATWEKFDKGLRLNHSENEMAYTPSVSAVETLLAWPTEDDLEGRWSEVNMHVNMITHTFKPSGLISPRTFISCVITALLADHSPSSSAPASRRGFMTVQIPLTHRSRPQQTAEFVPKRLLDKITSSAPKNAVFASYVSVERVIPLRQQQQEGQQSSERPEIEWIMATTSDAGGSIPAWVQRSWTMGGVPKAVVADVGLFLGWSGPSQ